jgi:hypothetical protein
MANDKSSPPAPKAWTPVYRDLTKDQLIAELRTASVEAMKDQRRIEEAQIVSQQAMELAASI